MNTLLQDLRYGARMLLKRPGFTLIVVVTLALGIGANTAIFSIVYGVLLKPLPYKDAERIVIASVSPPDFKDLKESSQSFDQTAIWASNMYNVTIGGEATQVRGAIVSPELLPMLTTPALGRFWSENEDQQYLAVISHDYWQNSFGGDPGVVGKIIRLYGKPHTIVGVTPPEFQYPSREFKIFNTMGAAMSEAPKQMENRQFRIFRAVAHLKPGVGLAQLQSEMETISRRLQEQYPTTNSGVSISFIRLYERIVGNVERALWVLLATVGFVLLIACVNVANLTLARLATREREIAIRAALGAGRFRLMRQILTESFLLAVIGGLFGVLLAVWSLDALVAFNPGDLPRLNEVKLNTPVLLFTFGVTILTGLMCGLIPARQALKNNLNQMLREGGRGALGGVKSSRLRGFLVVGEIAVSLMLLVGAGLLLKSFNRLINVETGYDAANMLTANLPLVEYKDPQRAAEVVREVKSRIAQVPGVKVAGCGSAAPPITAQRSTRFAVEGLPSSDGAPSSAYFIGVTPDYFSALGARLLDGRDFSERDVQQSSKVVIINRTMARKLFPNESAVGKRLQLLNSEQSDEWREIIGVVGDVRYSGLDDRGEAAIYTPFAQTPFMWANLVIRANLPPQGLIRDVRAAIKSVDPALEPVNFRTMEELIADSTAQPRFYTTLLGMFALLALLLASLGIYGVIAHVVTQRSREIGVRLALGATQGNVLRLMLRQGMTLALLGSAIGLVGAWALTRVMSNLLFETNARDPLTFAGVTLVLLTIALFACWIPSRRAARVDPMESLRGE